MEQGSKQAIKIRFWARYSRQSLLHDLSIEDLAEHMSLKKMFTFMLDRYLVHQFREQHQSSTVDIVTQDSCPVFDLTVTVMTQLNTWQSEYIEYQLDGQGLISDDGAPSVCIRRFLDDILDCSERCRSCTMQGRTLY